MREVKFFAASLFILVPLFFLAAGCGTGPGEKGGRSGTGETVVLPALTDTSLTPLTKNGRRKEFDNSGALSSLPLSAADVLLLDFDRSALVGKDTASARLYLHLDAGRLEKATISTLAGADWLEGSEKGAQQKGAACYAQAKLGKQDWAFAGGDFSDVSFGRGGSVYADVKVLDVSPEERKQLGAAWGYIEIPEPVLSAWAGGFSHGLALRVDNLDSCKVTAREAGEKSAFLKVTTAALPKGKQTVPPPVAVKDWDISWVGRLLEPGEAVFSWLPPQSAVPAAYAVRAVPVISGKRLKDKALLLDAASLQTFALNDGAFGAIAFGLARDTYWSFEVSAINRYGNESEPAVFYPTGISVAGSGILRTDFSGAELFSGEPKPFTRSDMDVIILPGEARVDPVTGSISPKFSGPGVSIESRNAVFDNSTSTVLLTAPRGAWADFQVLLRSETPLEDISLSVSGGEVLSGLKFYRVWYLPGPSSGYASGKFWGDPLIPLDEALSLPAEDNRVAGQTAMQVYGEVFIPYDVPRWTLDKGRLEVSYTPAGGRRTVTSFTLRVMVQDIELPREDSFSAVLASRGNFFKFDGIPPESASGTELEKSWRRILFEHRLEAELLPLDADGRLLFPGRLPGALGTPEAPALDFSALDETIGGFFDGSACMDLGRGRTPPKNFFFPFGMNYPFPSSADGEDFIERTLHPALCGTANILAAHLESRAPSGLAPRVITVPTGSITVGKQRIAFEFPRSRVDMEAVSGAQGFNFRNPNDFLSLVACPYSHPWSPLLNAPDILVTGDLFFRRGTARILSPSAGTRHVQTWNYGLPAAPWDPAITMRAWPWMVYSRSGSGLLVYRSDAGDAPWTQAAAGTLVYPASRFNRQGFFPSLRLKALRNGVQDVETLQALGLRSGAPNAFRRAMAEMLNIAIDRRGARSARVLSPNDLEGIVRAAAKTVSEQQKVWLENRPERVAEKLRSGVNPEALYYSLVVTSSYALMEPPENKSSEEIDLKELSSQAMKIFNKAGEVLSKIHAAEAPPAAETESAPEPDSRIPGERTEAPSSAPEVPAENSATGLSATALSATGLSATDLSASDLSATGTEIIPGEELPAGIEEDSTPQPDTTVKALEATLNAGREAALREQMERENSAAAESEKSLKAKNTPPAKSESESDDSGDGDGLEMPPLDEDLFPLDELPGENK